MCDCRTAPDIRRPLALTTVSLIVPDAIHTPRLLLRRWHPDDAPLLQAVLDANGAHLLPWIPPHVASSAPLPALAERLAGYRDDFDAARAWLYAILTPDATRLLGGVGLYPRTADARVPADAADRVEIGYWLRADATGVGHATEAARAMLDVARTLPGLQRVEIRCDPRNVRSVAVPRRLGFRPERSKIDAGASDGAALMIWTHGA
jgi:RimJ/RimL family protein N-acetyltransferase